MSAAPPRGVTITEGMSLKVPAADLMRRLRSATHLYEFLLHIFIEGLGHEHPKLRCVVRFVPKKRKKDLCSRCLCVGGWAEAGVDCMHICVCLGAARKFLQNFVKFCITCSINQFLYFMQQLLMLFSNQMLLIQQLSPHLL